MGMFSKKMNEFKKSPHGLFIITAIVLCCLTPISPFISSGDHSMNMVSSLIEGVEIVNAEKDVLFEGGLVETTFHLTYSNTGAKTRTNVYFLLNNTDYDHLAVFAYKEGNSPSVAVKKSKFNQLSHTDPNTKITTLYKVFEVPISTPLKKGENIDVVYTLGFTNKLIAHPNELELGVLPMYEFKDTLNVVSLYPVKSQTSSYSFKECNLIAYTPKENVKVVSKNELKYTFNSMEAPFSEIPFWLHLSTPIRYTSTVELHRKVYVSEYAEVEFVESHTIKNQANKLVGEFSRDRVAETHMKTAHIVNNVLFNLPKDSYNYYYRDMVGNISTSTITESRQFRHMDVTPRFPLMGGWNTEFTIKYKRPSTKVIKKQSKEIDSLREFKINLLGDCQDIVSIDHFILEIILPERAKVIKFEIPPAIDFNITQYNTYYYMDMYGRVTLRLEAHNLIPAQDTKLQIVYSYNSMLLLLKPYLASFGFFIVLITVSILSRTKFLNVMNNNHTSKVDELLECLQEFDDQCTSQLKQMRKWMSLVDSYRLQSIKKKSFDSKYSSINDTVDNDMKTLNVLYDHLCDIFPDCKHDKKLAVINEKYQLIEDYRQLVVKFRDENMADNLFIKAYNTIDNQIKCNKELISEIFD